MPPEMISSHCPYCGGELGEKLDEGRERLYCDSCERFVWRNPSPVAAMIVHDDDGKVLLVKRGIEPGKGKWSIPAGFLEIDESATEAAIRELEEETGLIAEKNNIQYTHNMNFERFPDQYLLATIFSVTVSNTKGSVEAGSDAEDAKFWDLRELKNREGEELRSNFLPAISRVEELNVEL